MPDTLARILFDHMVADGFLQTADEGGGDDADA